MIDTSTAKELLQSTDIAKLQETALSFDTFQSDHRADEEQIFKLQILLWSRIFQLQKASRSSAAEQAETLARTGSVWMRLGDTDRAIGQFKKSLELQPNGDAAVRAYQLLGQAHVNSSDYALASECHQRAIAELVAMETTSPQQLARAYCLLASVLELQSDYSTALQWLDRAVETYAKCDDIDAIVAVVEAQRGTLFEKLGEYGKAVGCLTLAHQALLKTAGEKNSRTQEISYLLEMAKELAT